MTSPATLEYAHPARQKFTRGWINLIIAALAMIATLPGRTQGIGLVTDALIADFKITDDIFAYLNIWATLIGSTFALAVGPLIDRFGSRIVLTSVMLFLGASVITLAAVTSYWAMFVMLVLTRGLGQSALSVVSLTIVGKWFSRRLPMAMAAFALITGVGFIIAFPGVKFAADATTWRQTWIVMGIIFLALLVPLSLFFVRNTPESVGLKVDGDAIFSADPKADEQSTAAASFTFRQALLTPIFWTFALASAFFLLVSSGMMLFNVQILESLGMQKNIIYIVLAIITFAGLLFNFLGGFLARQWPLGWLMCAAMSLLAVAQLELAIADQNPWLVCVYAAAMGASGGLVTVIFFICWGKLFGRLHLGTIQGAAQVLTVLASALGPWLLTETKRLSGAYTPFFLTAAAVAAVLAVLCFIVQSPTKSQSPATNDK